MVRVKVTLTQTLTLTLTLVSRQIETQAANSKPTSHTHYVCFFYFQYKSVKLAWSLEFILFSERSVARVGKRLG